jgi:hypothetical protein
MEDVIKRLTNRTNFKKAISLCLEKNVNPDIILNWKPEFNIYYYGGDISSVMPSTNNGDGSAFWLMPNIRTIKFKAYGVDEIMEGSKNFFIHLSKIHTIIVEISKHSLLITTEVLRVKFDKWYESEEHQEISFHLHSVTKPSYEWIDNRHNYVMQTINKIYYIDGEPYTEFDWKFKIRKLKLERILPETIKPKIKEEIKEIKKVDSDYTDYSFLTVNIGDYPYTVA